MTFAQEPRFGARVALGLLRFYKAAVSPHLGPACRFFPTCSEYAAEAVHRHGLADGVLLALWRLARCHPFARGGVDPVPDSGPLGRLLARSLRRCHHG